MTDIVWIGYTTRYREGGAQFARVARTLATEAAQRRPNARVRCVAVESKREFLLEMGALPANSLRELHFVGHSGMYGIMFGTVAHPEQLSPHEWRTLPLTFAANGEAFFHSCRSARWFAPFFARTFGVPSWGYHAYTTISARRDRFVASKVASNAPAYVIGIMGRRSHGYTGALLKRTGIARSEPMRRYLPAAPEGDASYDAVAELYDAAYPDIGVRAPEVRWLEARLPAEPFTLVDVGCGNGALLRRWAPRLLRGWGVDASRGMLRVAQRRNADQQHLSFHHVPEPTLPLDDHSVDVVVSMLSFRYLDWDPMLNEIRRVLRPGGRLLIVDMAAAPAGLLDAPAVLRSKRQQLRHALVDREFTRHRRALVHDPRWRTMLAYNPIRAVHEYVWYLESRFPGQKVETLDVGLRARILAFDSGPLAPGRHAPQTYP